MSKLVCAATVVLLLSMGVVEPTQAGTVIDFQSLEVNDTNNHRQGPSPTARGPKASQRSFSSVASPLAARTAR